MSEIQLDCVFDDGGGPTGTDPKSLHFPTSISFRSNEALCAVTANVMSASLNKKVHDNNDCNDCYHIDCCDIYN